MKSAPEPTKRNNRYVFQQLTTEKFRIRIRESFPGIYLTIISIIEGVALYTLADETFKYYRGYYQGNSIEPYFPLWIYSFISFISIIVVFYNYSWFVGLFRWSPKIWDVLLPFLLGFSQIGAMLSLTNTTNWWLLMAIFCLCGIFAFINTFYNCKEEMFNKTKIKAWEKTRKVSRFNIYVTSSAFIFCIIPYALHYHNLINHYSEALFLFLVFTGATMIIIRGERFQTDLHGEFKLSR